MSRSTRRLHAALAAAVLAAVFLAAAAAPALAQRAPQDMALARGGVFIMGSPENEPGRDADETQRRVEVEPFYIGRYEVTQEEFEAIMGRNPSFFKGRDLPVEQVTWLDAARYCNGLSLRDGLDPAYDIQGERVTWNRDALGYRLPTEAEWEYACRAGSTGPFNTGLFITSLDAAFNGTESFNGGPPGQYRPGVLPVGSFGPNALGLYDTHGNVQEWCWDEDADGNRAVRGGSWNRTARYLRSADRHSLAPDTRTRYLGFRVALSR